MGSPVCTCISMPLSKPSAIRSVAPCSPPLIPPPSYPTVSDQQALQSFVSRWLDRFLVRGQGGVVALTYSAMLSRGLENVKGDADEALGGATLIDRHGYATQELVNLLLVGRGHSNVFDGTRTLDDNSGRPLFVSILIRGAFFSTLVGCGGRR